MTNDDRGRCSSCKWHGELALSPQGCWGETKGWEQSRFCTHPNLRAIGEPDPIGRVVTLPDFGCVQWEAKAARG